MKKFDLVKQSWVFKIFEMSTCTFPVPHESPNDFSTLFIYQQDEQAGSDIPVDRASSNPYHMSIEGYFNPPEEASTRGRNFKMVHLPADNIFDPEKGAIFSNCMCSPFATDKVWYASMSMASNNTPIFWHKFTGETRKWSPKFHCHGLLP